MSKSTGFESVESGPVLNVVGGVLICPFCHEDMTHVDEASAGFYSGSDYDNGSYRANTATFNATNGTVENGTETDLTYSSRRHWLEVHIDCELCDGGSIVFAQCKGATEVFLVPTPVPVSVRVRQPKYPGERAAPETVAAH